MNAASTLLQLKHFVITSFVKVVSTLFLLLITILYLTSRISNTQIFSDTLIDVAITILYLLLIATLFLLAWSFYVWQEQESEVEIVSYYDDISEDKAIIIPSPEASWVQDVSPSPKLVTYHRRYRGFDFVESQPAKKVAYFLSQQHPKVTQNILATVAIERSETLKTLLGTHYIQEMEACAESESSYETLVALDLSLQEELHPLNEVRVYLKSLEKSEIQHLLLKIDKKELTYALMGFEQEFQERILATMSPKIATIFREVLSQIDSKTYRKIDNGMATLFLLAKQLREDAKMRATKQPTG